MDIIAPIPIDKQIIDAILKGQHDLVQEIRDRGQLLPLGTMITLYEGSEWRSRMPILMFIIYNGLQKGLESQIYRILKVFLDGLELGDRCTLLNSPYQIIGNPKPLQEESEGYVSDQGSEIKTTPEIKTSQKLVDVSCYKISCIQTMHMAMSAVSTEQI